MLIKQLYRFTSTILIFSILAPDLARAMDDEFDNKQTQVPLLQSPNKQKTSPHKSDSESSDDFSPRKNSSSSEEIKIVLEDQISPKKIENDSDSSSPPNTDSHSLTPSPPKNFMPLSTPSNLIVPQEEEKEKRVIDLKILPINTHIESQDNKQPEFNLEKKEEKFNAKLGGNEGKGSPHLIDIQKDLKELKGDNIIPSHPKNHSGMTQVGNVIYLNDQKEDIKFKNKKEVKKDIFLIEEEQQISSDKNSSQQPIQKKQIVVEFLKESFSKLNKTFEKSVPIELKKESVKSKPLLINEDEDFTEESPLLLKKEFVDIEKEGSNQQKPLEESLKDIFTEDEEQTALCFEEWIETASDKTLCQELEGFFETSVALGSLFAQDLENILKENSGLKKITIKDWIVHMGLDNNKQSGKVQILSKEMIQFYELFNQALASHIATTLFKDKIPEEDLEKFKAFLLHVKDFTIDGKLTEWQIAGALVGAGVAAVASYALNWLLGYNLVSVFADYDFWLKKVPSIVPPINGVLTGFIAHDAVARNAKLFIDWGTPDTTHFTIPMDSKVVKALRVKKAGAYGWALLPSFISAYYYWVATSAGVTHGFWGTLPFLGLNSIWDNSSRLISNEEKNAHKKHLQQVEKDYPSALKKDQANLLKELKKSDISLQNADQKDINHYYDAVYHSVLSKTEDLKTEDAKFAQTLHLLIFFLELENFKATEPRHKDSNPSSEVLQDSEKKDQNNPLESEEDTRITIPTSSNMKEDKQIPIDSKSSSDITQISDNQEEISFFEEEKDKKNPLLDPVEIENGQQKKTPTWREKIAKGLSWALPTMGTPLLAVGARYLLKEGILGCLGGFCWNNPVAVEIISDVGGLILWYGVSRVQKPSIQKNIEEFPGGKPLRTISQKPLRVGWQMWNYVVGALLTVPDFMLWVNATVNKKAQTALAKGLNVLSYIGIGCAVVPETINTADSLNGSSFDSITAANRVLSHVYASEGFRRDKLREINHDLKQFVKTLQPGVFKVLSTTIHSLRTVLKEGPQNVPPHLKRLFDDKVLKAFGELSDIFKHKKETYVEERHKGEKKKREEKKRNEEEMKSIPNYDVINDDN